MTARKPGGGKLADPQWREERARKASAAAHSIDVYVARVIARAPDLTAEHAAQLRAVLPPVPAEPQAGASDAAA